MQRILITGMSGTGKSTLIEALAARGFKAMDTDYGGYSRLVDAAPGELTGPGGGQDWIWDEDRIQQLLSTEDAGVLFVGGCSPNQGKFYEQFDRIVLLTASEPVIAARLATRVNNPFGKDDGELERTLQLKRLVEPALRRAAGLEIDTSAPLDEVVQAVLKLVEPDSDSGPGGVPRDG